jgi:transcriptional regulator with XRE-family HTH domain
MTDKALPEVEERRNAAVGATIRRYREFKGMTQPDLAKQVGKGVQQIHRYEAGKTAVPMHILQSIADALGVTLTRIVRESEDEFQRRWPEIFDRESTVSEPRTTAYAPQVARGLPQRIRVFIQQFLLELVNANVPEERVDTIRRILSSDEMYRFYVGGEPKEYSEEETLEGIQAHAEAFRQRLRRQGFDLAK